MSFTKLAPQILLQIASWIDIESDLASLAQVNCDFYNTLIAELYLRNAKNPEKSAILIAAATGNFSTLKKALQAWKVARGPAELLTSEAVKVLLEYGVDPNERDHGKRTSLKAASTRGRTEVVKILLAQPNIKVNAYDRDKGTPIIGAARNGHAEIVKMLLSAGAFAGCVRKEGQGPLHSAIGNKQPELMAAQANREDLVEILLTDKRIIPDLTVSHMGQTPLLEAAMKNNDAMVRLLLEAGANKEIQDSTFLSPAPLLDAPSAETRYKLTRDRLLMLSNPQLPED
ncbi:uncharacterized protein N7483_011886 [Penicillium malachiteum]|uniref:uncharacterized protein n=1 Tax=Penicillium malachiteum TaxID=1324776 RepID=UPI0025493DE5|nr:uncharacterized protein N7483_011886 [Penicillium malachiteum]KAJ5714705.1 hypothetical protein N7483_011886 [Penicillium malachiteum]